MINKLYIKPGCISCWNCENICPKAFKVIWTSQVQKWWEKIDENLILEAEKNCPVNVIVADNWEDKSEKFFEWEIIWNEEIAQNTRKISIKTDLFWFKAWQFVNLKLENNLVKNKKEDKKKNTEENNNKNKEKNNKKNNEKNQEIIRSYSILSWWIDNFSLWIKIWENSASWKIIKNLKIWEKINFSESKWNFILEKTENKKIFIWTWTWIVPLIAMAKSIPQTKKELIFWFRYEDEIFYEKEIEKIRNVKNKIIAISRPKENIENTKNSDWEIIKKWRVTDFLWNINSEDEVYICWNWEMIKSVKEILLKNNHPENLIFNESFWENKKVEKNILKKIFINWDFKYFWKIRFLLLIIWLLIPILYFFWWIFWISKYLLWDISWYSVLILMAIRPLRDLFSNISFFWKILSIRKELWIISAMVIFCALFEKFLLNPNIFFQNYFLFENFFWSGKNFLARISEITWVILLATSNILSQKILKSFWKPVQKLSYLYFFWWWFYIYLIWKTEALYWMIFILIITILAFLKNKKYF